jgi:26S proteasome regulatory subunit N5
LIETLKDVCDKKIYLEVEYARCCLMMVKWNENQANIEKAANIM